MSSKDNSAKSRSLSASGNEPIADLKNQVQENETRLYDFTIKVETIFVEQVSMREDIQAVLESVKLLAASVSSLTAEVREEKS